MIKEEVDNMIRIVTNNKFQNFEEAINELNRDKPKYSKIENKENFKNLPEFILKKLKLNKQESMEIEVM